MPAFQHEAGIDIYRFQQRHRNLLRRATAFARFVAGHTRQLASQLQLAVFRDPWGGHPLLGARPSCPTIFEVNALPSWELRYSRPDIAANRTLAAKLGDIERRCLRHCDRILCVSSVTAGALAAAGYAESKIEVIPNVAHDAFFDAAHQPCPIPQLADGRWFGYIGGLQPWQGVQTLIDSFGEVAADLPDCRLLMLHGDTRATATRALHKRILRARLAGRVVVHSPVTQHEVAGVLARLRFTAVPLADTLRNTGQGCCPIKLVESMAAGTPVIASDLAVCREWMRHEREGLLAPAGDTRAWSMAIHRMFHDDGLRERTGAAARKPPAGTSHGRRCTPARQHISADGRDGGHGGSSMTAPTTPKPVHKQLNLEELSPEARAAAQARKVSGNWELKPLIRLLGELAHVDEAVEQQAAKAKSRMILFTMLSFGSIFGAIVIAVILELGAVVILLPLGMAVLAVLFGMRWRRLKKQDMINDFRMCLRPVLRDISNDLDPNKKIKVEMDLTGPEDRKKTSKLDLPPGRFQKLTETIYTDPWCEVKLPLADGTTVILAFENYYCKLERRYRTSRGKIKWKTKWRKDVVATATLIPTAQGAWNDPKLQNKLEKSREKLKYVDKEGVTCARLERTWSFKGGSDCPSLAPPGPHVVGLMLRLHSAMPTGEAAQ